MRLLWGLLLLLALAASPLLALVLVVVAVVLLFPRPRKEYGRPSVTLRGEVVRSRSEKAIADWLSRNGIRYVYEYPAMTHSDSRMISRPDYYLPDYDVYVEYWGLANLPCGATGSRYRRSMRWKTEQYRRHGVGVISLCPAELRNLDAVLRSRLLEQACRRPNTSEGSKEE